MTGSFYDVVVTGMEPGPLCAAALLARRGFRVLVAGQKSARDRYHCLGYDFVKRPFLLTGATSPVISRIIEELSISQLYSHSEIQSEIKYQVVQPKSRVSVFGSADRTLQELAREFPAFSANAPQLFTDIQRYSTDFEKLVQNDLVIPPENFFERRDFSRAMVQFPFLSNPRIDFLDWLRVPRALRNFLMAPLAWSVADSVPIPPLVVARGVASSLFDTRHVRGGLDGLRQIICERIIEQGGDVQEQYVVDAISVARGKVEGVQFRGRTESVATRLVLTDLFPPALASLVAPAEWTNRFKILVDDECAFRLGYAVNLGVRREVIPVGMADTVFVVRQGIPSVLRVEVTPQQDDARAALNISCIVPESMSAQIDSGALRDTMLDAIRGLIPYLDRYLEVIHSPFDAFGAVDLAGIGEGNSAVTLYPEQIQRWQIQTPGSFSGIGIENLPHRTGIKGLLMAGAQVNTGLGIESELISGWGAARIAGKMDPTRQRIVRAMRSKIEI